MVEVRKPVDSDDLAPPAPLQLEIAPSLASLLGDEVETRRRVAGLAQGMREEYGVPIPVPQVRVSSALGEGEYRSSDESRVGKEAVSTSRPRCLPEHQQTK